MILLWLLISLIGIIFLYSVIVYEGTPAVETTATSPRPLILGMNKFLKMMNISFRRDPQNYRPRINKNGSVKDVEQKQKGMFFYYEDI
jgi:ATP-binding cassette subfamily E protein 1